MAYKDFINRFSTTPAGRFIAQHVGSRLDPWIYRKSGGRFTSGGPPTIPQLVLTSIGRRSGNPRPAQLGYARDGDDLLVVASNFGTARHPAWRANLRAEPRARVLLDGEEFPVVAEELDAAGKERAWPILDAVVPQYRIYRTRTDRDISIFRLRRTDA